MVMLILLLLLHFGDCTYAIVDYFTCVLVDYAWAKQLKRLLIIEIAKIQYLGISMLKRHSALLKWQMAILQKFKKRFHEISFSR